MRLPIDEIKDRAAFFAKRWEKGSRENAEAAYFIEEFMKVFGVDDPVKVIKREVPVYDYGRKIGSIDFFWKGYIAIETKSRGVNLEDAFTQLKNYMGYIPEDDKPDLWMTCNFERIRLWKRSKNIHVEFRLSELHKNIKWFNDISGYAVEVFQKEQQEVNIKAADKMATLHQALKSAGYGGHELEVYLVRLLFCLFADDTGIFDDSIFYKYIKDSKEDGSDLHSRIHELFEILNMPPHERENKLSTLSESITQFRYINGRLFEKPLRLFRLDAKMRKILLTCCEFDWSKVSPAIFGAMFQGVMDEDERQEKGAHYTSEENILKIINPLFMDELWDEYGRVKNSKKELEEFHDKISKLKFLDPACGCGNFLIVAYRELRRLEMEVIRKKYVGNALSLDFLLKVDVSQFYGIEILDFPCEVAKVGMWLTEHQMNMRLTELGRNIMRFPLAQSATIIRGNALRMDWNNVVPNNELSYIFGNPPFVGHQYRTNEQHEDMAIVYGQKDKCGKLDYVCCWYEKAIFYMKDTNIRTAFVSTNSIVQGESVSIMWQPIIGEKGGFDITFAHTPFVWSNDAKHNAAVHCVIVGIAKKGFADKKRIYDKDTIIDAKNINGYLLPADNIFIQSRGRAPAGMPEMSKGSQPTDGGYLILSSDERGELITQYPQTSNWIKRYLGSVEYINGLTRYCLWLKGVAPAEYRSIKPIAERLKKVSDSRRKSPTDSVRQDADTPMLFTQIRQPSTRYLAVPEVSSEQRKYIPIGYLDSDVIASNKLYIISSAELYLFGILTSSVHMAWTRVVCGRMKSDYSYSPSVYNNFPWIDIDNNKKVAIGGVAQAILDARAKFPESSLADLYDPIAMPPELLQAHRKLDRAVLKLYGYRATTPESAIVADLMGRYKEMKEKQEK